MLHASLDYLVATGWRELGGYAQGQALRSLAAAQAKWSAAHAGALLAFDESGGYAADGHPTARTWLQHQTRTTRAAARELGQAKSRLAAHPLLRDAQATGEVSESWIRQIALWTDRLPADEVDKADEILLDAARAGLDLHPDIARLAEAIVEAIRGQRPDVDPEDDGFADRGVRMGTTIGGAGKLSGDLSAPCAALLEQVLVTFGKPAGRDDLRNPGQRNHDALETALRLSLGVPGIPDSGGLKTRAQAVVSLADLLRMDGASALQDAWLAAKAGEPGWFFGPAARAAACSAQVTPVVTGTADWVVLAEMADVFLDAHRLGERGERACGCTCGGCDCPPPAGPSGPLSSQARMALERTLLAMAVRALSGPDGLAGFLRANLLGKPFSGASLVLDVGATDDIPDHIRRAVILRDKKCQWPGGCDRPASQCEPHHRRHRADGGETSLDNLDLYCFAHHHVFIHRYGWQVIKHPDGTRDAISPDGKIVRSHAPHAPPGGTVHAAATQSRDPAP
jgi:hypothetical protein